MTSGKGDGLGKPTARASGHNGRTIQSLLRNKISLHGVHVTWPLVAHYRTAVHCILVRSTAYPMFDTNFGLESLVVSWANAQVKIHGETE